MKCNLSIFCNSTPVHFQISDTIILIFEIIILSMIFGVILYAFLRMVTKKRNRLFKNFIITTIGVILFEIMIQPMVLNTRWSSWTYYYHDLSIIVTFGWVVIVSGSIYIIDAVFAHMSDFKRFWLYLCTIDAITLPVEIFLVQSGVRTYSQSLIQSSLGVYIPYTNLPLEVGFAIPLFFALVIGFVKYWEKIIENG